MKTKILNLVLILSVVFFTNCKSNDDVSTQQVSLDGTWNAKNISGGFAGINDDYQEGEITWTFNNQNLTLNVENNTTQQNVFTGLESGTYNYSTIENNGKEYLYINNDDYGRYILSLETMSINQNESTSGSGNDGFTLVFER